MLQSQFPAAHIWASLQSPSYVSDLDFAILHENRLILIDAKNWAAGHVYWSSFGMQFRGLRSLSKAFGEHKEPSRNTAYFKEMIQAQLPGVAVSAMVIFVPSDKGALPTSVSTLRWPGGIRLFLP